MPGRASCAGNWATSRSSCRPFTGNLRSTGSAPSWPRRTRGGRELLRLAENKATPRGGGGASYPRGLLVPAREVGREPRPLGGGVALYDPVRDRARASSTPSTRRVVCLHWLSHSLLILGYPGQARARSNEALASARELAHPNTMAQALFCDWTLHQLLRDGREPKEQAEALIALTTEHGLPLWLAAGVVFRGWALAAGGRAEDGIAVIRGGLDRLPGHGIGAFLTLLPRLCSPMPTGGRARRQPA